MNTCPKCGTEYKRLGGHWRYNPDHRPELTEKQLDIINLIIIRFTKAKRL
mgnify:CR=1 FL=1